MLRTRGGHTIVETLVALALGTLVVGLGAVIGFRHQRFHRDIVVAIERAEQLDQVVALVPIALRSISTADGDIAPGAARDTSLEFRATIAASVVCDTGHATATLAPVESPRLTSTLTRPEPGDTAWILAPGDSTEVWVPHPILAVVDSATVCAIGDALPFGGAPRPALALRLSAPLPARWMPVRITRPWRYSLYRASDGGWYLGAKDWNAALSRFNTVQPVGGPFASAAAGGLRFSYYDSAGTALPAGTADTRSIALVEVAFRVDSVIPGKYHHAASIRSRSVAAIAIRNGPR